MIKMSDIDVDEIHLCPLCSRAVRTNETISIVNNGSFTMLAHEACEKARSTKQEWGGTGLPPVGVECEALFMHGASTRWRKCKVLMHGERECAVFVPEISALGWCNTFRPLKSQHEHQRDELRQLLCGALRQLRHNSSDGFVAAYDVEETLDILSNYNLEPKL